MSGTPPPRVVDLGRLSYDEAYARQVELVEATIASRGEGPSAGGTILLVEHDPVITVTRRAGAAGHVLAGREALARAGVSLRETDRGGDVTYHGPGQVVVYPILDLNAYSLGLHDYVRLLEEAMIRACAHFGVGARRDDAGTGVWVDSASGGAPAKIGAIGVRVRRWVSFHGLALNVTTNLDHFSLIVPCGLAGRGVTSLARELGGAGPGVGAAKAVLARELAGLLRSRAAGGGGA